MKRTFSFVALTLVLLVLLSACSSSQSSSNDASSSKTGISSMKFSVSKSELSLDAGETETGYFKVECSGNLSVDDIEFVSSNSSVASFCYDKTALSTCVYYKIEAISAGTATVYAQTKDGKIKTDDITVIVTGYSYSIPTVDDISSSGAKRHRARATVPDGYIDNMSSSEIENILKFIASNYSSSHSVNSITVFLYVEGDNLDDGFTVGCCTYAPYGDIGRASEVEAGDYTSFDFCDIQVFSKDERDALRNN